MRVDTIFYCNTKVQCVDIDCYYAIHGMVVVACLEDNGQSVSVMQSNQDERV